MLPSRTTPQSGPMSVASDRALRSRGFRYDGLSAETSTPANLLITPSVTSVSGVRSPAFGVMTNTPAPETGDSGSGGCLNAVEYASLPRKYKPLRKLNTSPSGAPCLVRSRAAKSNVARSDITMRARLPPQLAGDKRKMWCGYTLITGYRMSVVRGPWFVVRRSTAKCWIGHRCGSSRHERRTTNHGKRRNALTFIQLGYIQYG